MRAMFLEALDLLVLAVYFTGLTLDPLVGLAWILGLFASKSVVAILNEPAPSRLFDRSHRWELQWRLCGGSMAGLAGFGVALLADRGKSFLYVFFALFVYDSMVWELVLGSLEDAGIGALMQNPALSFGRALMAALLEASALLAFLSPMQHERPTLNLSLPPVQLLVLSGPLLLVALLVTRSLYRCRRLSRFLYTCSTLVLILGTLYSPSFSSIPLIAIALLCVSPVLAWSAPLEYELIMSPLMNAGLVLSAGSDFVLWRLTEPATVASALSFALALHVLKAKPTKG